MKVGDYIRTKYGIHKIFRINEKATVWKYDCDKKPTGDWDSSYEYIKIREEDIIKSSPNIIDLIEVGDILYLEESDDIACMFFKDIYLVKNEDNLLNIISDIKNKKCKLISIVTKEQFEAIKYEIK